MCRCRVVAMRVLDPVSLTALRIYLAKAVVARFGPLGVGPESCSLLQRFHRVNWGVSSSNWSFNKCSHMTIGS